MAASSSDVLFQRGKDNDSDAWDDTALIKAYDEAISAMKAKLADENPELIPQPGPSKGKKKKKSKSKKKQSSSHRWKSGDRCQAVYSEDGDWYEARIMSIDQENKMCTVQYIGYGNEEQHLLSELQPPGSVTSSHKTDTASEAESTSQTQESQPPIHNSKPKSRKASKQNNQHTMPNGEVPPMGHMPLPPFGQMTPPPQMPQFPGFTSGVGAAPPMFSSIPPPPPLFSQPGGSGEDNEALYSMLISWYMSGYHTGYYQGLRQASTGFGAASGHKPPR